MRITAWLSGLLAALAIAGCAAPGARALRDSPGQPRSAELAATPFFSQETDQCGPAALATVLGAIGIDRSPETLSREVYLPARNGSLQIEMLAGARRNGALAFMLPDRPDAVVDEVRHGHPVLVLLNLGLSWAPSWHYAVVVGFDLDRGTMILRSGPMRRQEMSLDTFLHTWNRSDRWAFVALRPGDLPASASEQQIEAATLDFARLAPAGQALAAYRAAHQRWPDNLPLAVGLANSTYAVGDLATARTTLEAALRNHPDDGAVLNNLANVLAAQGQLGPARELVERALKLDPRWQDAARDTLAEIERRERGARPAR